MNHTKYILLTLVGLAFAFSSFAKDIKVSGTVADGLTKAPLYYAAVNLVGTNVFDITTEKGEFILNDVKPGKYTMMVSILGYLPYKQDIVIKNDISNLSIYLDKSSLEMDEVVVTATSTQSDLGSTTYKIGNQAIEQIQAVSVNDILQLIPGAAIGQTDMNSTAQINLRSAEVDNSNSFGTAVIVDGNQMSNDGNMQAYNSAVSSSGGNNTANGGIDLRDIPASNIESVEVISGVASAKYGNITSGALIIKRKAGYTPWRAGVNMTPNSYQASLSKGSKLSHNLGFLNVDVDYTYSKGKNTSDRNYYQRSSLGVRWTNELSKRLSWSNNLYANIGYSIDGERDDPDELIVISEVENSIKQYTFSDNGSFKFLGRTSYSFSVNFSDQYAKRRLQEDGPIPIIDALESGTNITSYTPNSFYQTTEVIGAPLNLNGRIETDQNFETGRLLHKTNIGIEYSFNKNYGEGRVLPEGSTAATAGAGTRAMDFYNIPASTIYSAYFQDNKNP